MSTAEQQSCAPAVNTILKSAHVTPASVVAARYRIYYTADRQEKVCSPPDVIQSLTGHWHLQQAAGQRRRPY